MTKLWGGIEAGGTKFVCAVGTGPQEILAETRFPTTAPRETLGLAIEFFEAQEAAHGRLSGLGVAAFGPLDPRPDSPTFGTITTTPKPGWAHAEIVRPLQEALDVPVAFDTDVNGAALGEMVWGAARGLSTFLYLTVGTGIGGGAVVNGQLLHGLLHPEMGHLLLPHDKERDPYLGRCPYHGDCLEGLASGPAIEDRWGVKGQQLDAAHPAWELEAHYLALALHNYTCLFSPQRIIAGGGVMEQPQLLPMLREKLQASLNGYVQDAAVLQHIDQFVVAPGLGNRAGVLGAMALAGAGSTAE